MKYNLIVSGNAYKQLTYSEIILYIRKLILNSVFKNIIESTKKCDTAIKLTFLLNWICIKDGLKII